MSEDGDTNGTNDSLTSPNETFPVHFRYKMIKLPPVSDDFQEQPSLTNLPVELLIKIFEHLHPYFLSRTVTLVCKRFARILNDDLFWKRLLGQTISRNSCLPVRTTHLFNFGLIEERWSCGRDILWRDLAVQLNILEHKWRINTSAVISRNLQDGHYAPVDAVKIIGNGEAVVSGGRDRVITLWKVNTDNLHLNEEMSIARSHNGWVWDIDSCSPESFFTCGWDNYVTHWSVGNQINKLSSFNCGHPVMSITATQGLVAAGLHAPRIVLIDPRVGGLIEQIGAFSSYSFNIHRMAVTDVLLVPDKNLLLSISEDKTLCFFDLRRQRLCYKTVVVSSNESFPRCLGYYRDVIYVGDSRGNIRLYSLDTGIPEISIINVGTNTRVVTSIVPHLGGITVGTTDSHVRILYPSNPPVVLWDQTMPGEVTSVDYNKKILVVSTATNAVTIFRPPSI